jgi:hypothetical protein
MRRNLSILFFCLYVQLSFAQLLIDQTPYIPFRQGKKWGAADMNMVVKIPAKYDEMGPFYYGVSLVKLKKNYGVINGQDQVVLPLEYEYIPNFTYTQGFGFSFVVYHQGKWGVIDEKQQRIIALTDLYDHIDFLEDSLNNDFLLAAYTKKGLVKEYTVYTKKGEKIIEKLVADTLFFNEERISDFEKRA